MCQIDHLASPNMCSWHITKNVNNVYAGVVPKACSQLKLQLSFDNLTSNGKQLLFVSVQIQNIPV